ncbi:hypothetical protein POREN0001_0279 [Porphyromonas endodontalis ATCC 35406]|uniref:Uncharacterized protein n=1 Tax=Porphyromonas endodontalis (strain ATCC 35406 / DSM 24491 / JCM 8526 / CCUG 16442 / BCRC 14492 / NCTC 13058 / HG 370) TaxID=553175 RepID=C3JAP2_POREA|nr:hypothetical protein POREN0001_0279 [Porphyromonas endodontalis ATCC 35406]
MGDIPYCSHLFIVLNGEKEPYYSNIQQYTKDLQINTSLIYTEKKRSLKCTKYRDRAITGL